MYKRDVQWQECNGNNGLGTALTRPASCEASEPSLEHAKRCCGSSNSCYGFTYTKGTPSATYYSQIVSSGSCAAVTDRSAAIHYTKPDIKSAEAEHVFKDYNEVHENGAGNQHTGNADVGSPASADFKRLKKNKNPETGASPNPDQDVPSWLSNIYNAKGTSDATNNGYQYAGYQGDQDSGTDAVHGWPLEASVVASDTRFLLKINPNHAPAPAPAPANCQALPRPTDPAESVDCSALHANAHGCNYAGTGSGKCLHRDSTVRVKNDQPSPFKHFGIKPDDVYELCGPLTCDGRVKFTPLYMSAVGTYFSEMPDADEDHTNVNTDKANRAKSITSGKDWLALYDGIDGFSALSVGADLGDEFTIAGRRLSDLGENSDANAGKAVDCEKRDRDGRLENLEHWSCKKNMDLWSRECDPIKVCYQCCLDQGCQGYRGKFTCKRAKDLIPLWGGLFGFFFLVAILLCAKSSQDRGKFLQRKLMGLGGVVDEKTVDKEHRKAARSLDMAMATGAVGRIVPRPQELGLTNQPKFGGSPEWQKKKKHKHKHKHQMHGYQDTSTGGGFPYSPYV